MLNSYIKGQLCYPTESQLVKNMFEAAKRISAKEVQKKQPLTAEHLKLLHEKLVVEDKGLSPLRTFTLIILGFCGFLRYSEL